jgi:hypothetical protein
MMINLGETTMSFSDYKNISQVLQEFQIIDQEKNQLSVSPSRNSVITVS